MKFRSKEFRVYQEAKAYCLFCRNITLTHIEKIDRSLAGQIYRALISIVLNIAEGSADKSDIEFARFLVFRSDQHMKPLLGLAWQLYTATLMRV